MCRALRKLRSTAQSRVEREPFWSCFGSCSHVLVRGSGAAHLECTYDIFDGKLRLLVEALLPSAYEHEQMSIPSWSDQSLSVQPQSVQPRSGVLRQRTRTVTAFCHACNTPWTLTCEQRGGVWVVLCTKCGDVRPPRHDLVEPSPWE